MDDTPSSVIRTANAEVLAEGDLEAVERFFARGYVAHGTGRDLPRGHEAIRAWVRALRTAFSDLEVEVEVLVETPERVAWQRTVRGTDRRDFQGFPATNRAVRWRESMIIDGRPLLRGPIVPAA